MGIYLDNAATSYPKPATVLQAVDAVLREHRGNSGRGMHASALQADRFVLQAREAVTSFFGGRDSSRFVFTPSATQAINQALFGFLQPGDRVVTSSMEHNALLRPLHHLAQQGVEVVSLPVDEGGLLDADDLRRALQKKTALVALGHGSNVNGVVQRLEPLVAAAKAAGALFLLDASQTAGHLPIDVAAMNLDFLAVPGHKGLLGPQGVGLLYVASGLQLQPLVYGGTGTLSSDLAAPSLMPERLEAGTLNLPGIAGLGAAVDWLKKQGVEQRQTQLKARLNQLVDGLSSCEGLRLYGAEHLEDNCGLISLTVKGGDPAEIGFRLDREFEIATRVGLHCAPAAHKSLGTFPDGTVRLSPSAETTAEEIEAVIGALKAVARTPRRV